MLPYVVWIQCRPNLCSASSWIPWRMWKWRFTEQIGASMSHPYRYGVWSTCNELIILNSATSLKMMSLKMVRRVALFEKEYRRLDIPWKTDAVGSRVICGESLCQLYIDRPRTRVGWKLSLWQEASNREWAICEKLHDGQYEYEAEKTWTCD